MAHPVMPVSELRLGRDLRVGWSLCQTSQMGVLAWIAVGLVAGSVARVVVRPGRRLGCLGTVAVGLAGSVVGGTLANVVAGDGLGVAASGVIGSLLGAVLILALARLKN